MNFTYWELVEIVVIGVFIASFISAIIAAIFNKITGLD